MGPGTRRIAHRIVFRAAVLLSAASLAAQEIPARDDAERSWPQTPAAVSRIAATSIGTGQQLIRFSGRALDAAGQPVTAVAGVTFAIYEEQSGGAPLWQETQNLATDASGRFNALLGATSTTGIPSELFSSGDARWLAVLTHAPGVAEQPRVLLVSVPYAIQAANADTLSGLPASAFVRTSPEAAAGTSPQAAAPAIIRPLLSAAGAGANYLPLFTDTSGDLKNSALFQVIAPTTTYLGFGTTNPSFNLHFVSTVDPAAVTIDGYGTVGINFIGRRAEGTLLNPTNLLANDNIMAMQGRGYGKTAFTPYSRAYMKFFAAENWSDTAQGTYISMATTTMGTAPATPAAERLRITDAGLIGIGTQSPTHTLGFGASATLGVEANPNAGGAGNSLSISAGAAASGATNQPGGDLFLAAGNGTGEGASGNLHLQSAGDAASGTAPDTVSDRMLIVGKPKAMSGTVPTANLFSLQIATGEAAGGKVKFTIVASNGVNYAMETGEIAFLASPFQLVCGVVLSEYSSTPPTYTNNVLAVPAVGQPGWLNAQCNPTYFGSNLGIQIFDTEPTSFTPTTHKVYYTIENQSQALITLQP